MYNTQQQRNYRILYFLHPVSAHVRTLYLAFSREKDVRSRKESKEGGDGKGKKTNKIDKTRHQRMVD
jgi:hypothetical protein